MGEGKKCFVKKQRNIRKHKGRERMKVGGRDFYEISERKKRTQITFETIVQILYMYVHVMRPACDYVQLY